MIESNSLISASAGTGKTFALATRFIRLMMLDKVKPESVVALTFSRAAAQEIYEKILSRLGAASESDENAEKEWENLLDDFRMDEAGRDKVPDGGKKLAAISSKNIPHDAGAFRNLLRKLVNTQHLGAIATIDSFLLRFYQNFPKEMGFQNAIEVIDPVDEANAVDDALKRALSRKSGGEEIMNAFQNAKGGDFSRTCLGSISDILSSGWRNFLISHPGCEEWTVESMCAALDIQHGRLDCPDLSGLPVNEIKRKGAVAPERKFIDFVRVYDGKKSFLPGGKVDEMIRYFWENPDAISWEYGYYKESYAFKPGEDGAKAVREAVRYMMNLHLKYMLEKVKACIDLAKAVEGEYHRTTRRSGRLTFDDITKNTTGEEFTARGEAIKNVEFRFDSKFDHWALDEFQDTSELQWNRLQSFVSEVAAACRNGESRSAMAVGDLKQSIYTWRGASSRPFEEIATWPAFEGYGRDLKKSFRYGPNITDFINRVFGVANIGKPGVIPETCRDAASTWIEGWRDHSSDQPADYIKVIGAVEDEDAEEDDRILSALCAEISLLWQRHESEQSKDTVAVVVRSNTDGQNVAEYLRSKGLPAVWEGMNPVSDLPVVQAILALLKLADHPEDTAAWRIVNDLYGVRESVFPELRTAAAVSSAVSRMLCRQGLSRTVKEICERIGGEFESGSVAPERLRQFVEMAVAFEARESNGGSVDEFATFLETAEKRESAASSNVIRVLTIHRSKGLGFDHLFVPVFEKERARSAIDRPKIKSPLYPADRDAKWVLPHLHNGLEAFNSKTAAAYRKMCNEKLMESLRTYYVALTRAKKSMYVIFPDDSNPDDYGKGLLMRDLIVNAVGTLPYKAGDEPLCKNDRQNEARTVEPDIWKPCGLRETIGRTSPSATSSSHDGPGISVESFFDAGFGKAAKRGTEAHARYEKIEWADEALARELPEAFRPAFVRPSADATVWRERSYELFIDGRWESGQFDRVVFTGGGAMRKAVIYDFKTNAIREGESVAAFEKRIAAMYSRQMQSYRAALSRLIGIAMENVKTVLLLESSASAVAVS